MRRRCGAPPLNGDVRRPHVGAISDVVMNYLNRGYIVAAGFEADLGAQGFVRIRPVPKPGVPREEPYRFLNSKYGIFDYWSFSFRRMVLSPAWKEDENNYDHYLLSDERCETRSEADFWNAVAQLVPDPSQLKHVQESECPE